MSCCLKLPGAPTILVAPRLLRCCVIALMAAFLVVPQAEAGSRKKEARHTASRAVDKKAMSRAESIRHGARRLQATITAGRGKSSARAKSVMHSLRPLRPQVLVEVERPAPRQSFGEQLGLHETRDALDLKSSVALVIDQDTQEVLLRKNDQAVLPIASLTKLMTGLIVSEARLALDEPITIDQDDVDTEKRSRSRLRVGTALSRGELLHLALMSSENRAAHALARTFPGGMARFVSLMNARAMMLGMRDTRYVEPTGLSSANQSSAIDLATLVQAAHKNALIRELTTSPGYEVEIGSRLVQFNNTNRLVSNPDWDIGLQKTGYISEAGQCLVMQTRIAGRRLIMVFLDSAGRLSRLGDAERVRHWVEAHPLPYPSLRTSLRGVSG